MLAGHDECGTDFVEVDGVKKMRFYGMSSREAMNKYRRRCRWLSRRGRREVLLDYRGPVENTLQDILGVVLRMHLRRRAHASRSCRAHDLRPRHAADQRSLWPGATTRSVGAILSPTLKTRT